MSSEDRDLPKGWLAVYVPRPGTSLREELAPGSGLVGSEESDDERMRIDFEGNLHDLPELARYADRVERAGERHQWTSPGEETGYPTSSCAYVERGELIRVGQFDPLTRRLEIGKPEVLAKWLEVGAVPDRVRFTGAVGPGAVTACASVTNHGVGVMTHAHREGASRDELEE